MSLPCENIKVRLMLIRSASRPDDHHQLIPPSGPLQEKVATVLHLMNYCESSFIDIEFLVPLWVALYGPDVPLPHIDNDTRVILQWHYLPLDEPEVTTHRVLRNSRYQIILRKQDWEGPIRNWLQMEYAQQQHIEQNEHQLDQETTTQHHQHSEKEPNQRSSWGEDEMSCNQHREKAHTGGNSSSETLAIRGSRTDCSGWESRTSSPVEGGHETNSTYKSVPRFKDEGRADRSPS